MRSVLAWGAVVTVVLSAVSCGSSAGRGGSASGSGGHGATSATSSGGHGAASAVSSAAHGSTGVTGSGGNGTTSATGAGGHGGAASATGAGGHGGASSTSASQGAGGGDAGPTCVPRSCADQGYDCGTTVDGCGTLLDCGTCAAGQTCGCGGPGVCGPDPCSGLCKQQTTCPAMGTTSVSGKVYAPNGKDPLYDVMVYVPNGVAGAPTWGVQPFAPGVTCGVCGSEVTGAPLVSTVTGPDGSFTLSNVPVGTGIPLVMQKGRWRRKITIPTVTACANTALTAVQTSMPATQAQGDPADNIPLMALVTGQSEPVECTLRKIGIADSQFSDPAMQGGAGRVRFYLASTPGFGSSFSAATPKATQLYATAEIDQYDMVFFACDGGEYAKSAAQQQLLIDYASAGGRVYASHYGYVWLYDDAPFSGTASWMLNQGDPPNSAATIDQSTARGAALAQWVVAAGASTTAGKVNVAFDHHDVAAVVVPPSVLWATTGTAVPTAYSFDTPVGNAPAQQCGRVLYFEPHANPGTGVFGTFPAQCAGQGAMSSTEKLFEYLLFDLDACIAPPVCQPATCRDRCVACGAASDGCGGVIQCGTCPPNQACVGGACVGCAPATCASQGFQCGMQGDGCGDLLDCGTCPLGAMCVQGMCSGGTCQPATCATLSPPATCGLTDDGCGATLDCGPCPAGQVCGGGGAPNQCATPACTPRTCADQGLSCGPATDGCGGMLDCGTCPAPETCGGCGAPNVCCTTG